MDSGYLHVMDAATVFHPIWSPNLLLFKIVNVTAGRWNVLLFRLIVIYSDPAWGMGGYIAFSSPLHYRKTHLFSQYHSFCLFHAHPSSDLWSSRDKKELRVLLALSSDWMTHISQIYGWGNKDDSVFGWIMELLHSVHNLTCVLYREHGICVNVCKESRFE
jgi:hypothetical protein